MDAPVLRSCSYYREQVTALNEDEDRLLALRLHAFIRKVLCNLRRCAKEASMHKGFALAALIGATLLFAGTAAFAQVETTPIPRVPKPDFSSMKFLVGTWNCSETNTRRASAYGSTVTYSMDPSGYWLDTKTRNHATSWDRYPTVGTDKTTYDAANSRWVDMGVDDEGNYTISTSSGWKGNTIVWQPQSLTSVSSGNVVSSGAQTNTKVNARKYTYTSSFKESGGRTISVKGTCNKTT